MTVIAVLARPPRAGLVLPELIETTPLGEQAVAELYEALLRDTLLAIDRSGGELLVNYLPDEELPAAHRSDIEPAAELRAIAADTLEDVSAVRFEPQVGLSRSARAGNTITHLLETEGVSSAAVVFGTAPLMSRTIIDSAAMKLRTNEVVVGPAIRGGSYYAGFSEPIDFAESFAGIDLERLTARAADAGLETEFLQLSPRIQTNEDLLSFVTLLRARVTAERIVPEYTAEFIYERGIDVVESEAGPELVVDSSA